MRYFIFIILGAITLGVGWAVIFYFSLGNEGTPEARFVSEWYERKEAAASKRDERTLFLVGGSSGFYGIDTKVLGEQTGIRAVNFSTHAALSLDYILDRAKSNLDSGDVVILMLEYSYYVESGSTDLMMDFVLGADAEYFRSMSSGDQLEGLLSDSVFDLFQRIGFGMVGKGENQRSVNTSVNQEMRSLGNRTGHQISDSNIGQTTALLGAPPVGVLFMGSRVSLSNAWHAIQAFADWCKSRDIQLFAAFPPLLDHPKYQSPLADETAASIRAQYQRMGIPVLGEFRESLRPHDEFFDSVYHLNEEAKSEMTHRLMDNLKLKLN